MSRYAIGRKSKFISDRSGFAFPYRERVMEWNGNVVHKSEYEVKHPQLTPRKPPLEPQALYQPRPQEEDDNRKLIVITNTGLECNSKSRYCNSEYIMSFTLTTLTDSVKEWTQNDESTFVAEIPFFIKNAEERIFKTVDLDYFRKNVEGTATASNKFLQKPTDYMATFSLSLVSSGSNIFLLQKDVNFLQEYHPDPTATGTPKYYAQFDVNNFILAPTPDSSYAVELHYYYRPASLTTDDSGTTWISTNAPDALLYGTLLEAYTFMKGEKDLIDLYNGRYLESIARLKNYAEGRNYSDAFREGLVRQRQT
jgi:hypothetical protein